MAYIVGAGDRVVSHGLQSVEQFPSTYTVEVVAAASPEYSVFAVVYEHRSQGRIQGRRGQLLPWPFFKDISQITFCY